MVAPSGECLRGKRRIWCICRVKAVWSTPERFWGEVLNFSLYKCSAFTFTFTHVLSCNALNPAMPSNFHCYLSCYQWLLMVIRQVLAWSNAVLQDGPRPHIVTRVTVLWPWSLPKPSLEPYSVVLFVVQTGVDWKCKEYFHQKLLKSDGVWPSYGWWKTEMFFETRCKVTYLKVID